MKPYPYLCSINLKNYIMRTKQVYIVQYNDCYGNGTDKKLEAVIESKDDFKSWLEQHNEERDEAESEEEFDLIPLNLITFKK
jgi:flagellar biosynthesis/type III secretory pathway ATPase